MVMKIQHNIIFWKQLKHYREKFLSLRQKEVD